MKELLLFIDGQATGPFPSDDVKARLSAGELSVETPCAEPGATEWKPLGEVFAEAVAPKRTVVRLARKTQEEEQEMKSATSEKLDPEVRKKLMLYNLADSISVDKFTPVQAEAAIRIHEESLKKGKKLKIAAGIGGFLLSFGLASALFTGINFGTAPGGKGQKLFEKIFEEPADPALKKTAQRIRAEAERLEALREEVAAIKFAEPRNQGDPRQAFLGNVEIKNPDVSTVSGTLDISALPPGLAQSGTFEVLQLKRLDGATEDLIKKQNELLAILSSPLWTDADLREAIADELSEKFPKCDAPEAAEFAKRLAAMRIEGLEAQLHWMSKRLGEIAQSKEIQTRIQGRMKEKLSSRKKSSNKKDSAGDVSDAQRERVAASRRAQDWAAREMPKFLEKLTDFLAEKEIHYSAEARAAAWKEFTETSLPEIQNKITENELQRVPVSASGAFILDGRNDRNILAVAHFERAGDVYFVPAREDGKNNLLRVENLSVNRKILTPEDVLPDEQYVVAEKTKTGGVPLATSGKILSQEIFIVRTTPEWFYVTVEKKREEGDVSRRKTSVILGVPAEFYESVKVGDSVPMEKLLTFPRFGKPAESPGGGRLMPIPDDKLEAVKEQQTNAGMAFPPPPEKFVVPEVNASPAEPEVQSLESTDSEAESDDVPESPASKESVPDSEEE